MNTKRANKYNLVKYQLQELQNKTEYYDELRTYYLETSELTGTSQYFQKVEPEVAEILKEYKKEFIN